MTTPRRRPDQVRAAQQTRRARNSAELSALLAHRQDLAGISQVADLFVEAVKWSA